MNDSLQITSKASFLNAPRLCQWYQAGLRYSEEVEFLFYILSHLKVTSIEKKVI